MNTAYFKGREYPVYERDEAIIQGIAFRPWRDGATGDWIETDTGRIMQVVKRGKVGKIDTIQTAAGTFPVYPTTHCTHIEREDRYSFSGRKRDNITMSRGVRRFVSLYVQGCVFTGLMEPLDVYRMAFPKARSERYMANRIDLILADESAKAMVRDEVKAALIKHEMTPDKLITELQDLLTRSKKHEDPAKTLAVLKEIKALVVDLNLGKMKLTYEEVGHPHADPDGGPEPDDVSGETMRVPGIAQGILERRRDGSIKTKLEYTRPVVRGQDVEVEPDELGRDPGGSVD